MKEESKKAMKHWQDSTASSRRWKDIVEKEQGNAIAREAELLNAWKNQPQKPDNPDKPEKPNPSRQLVVEKLKHVNRDEQTWNSLLNAIQVGYPKPIEDALKVFVRRIDPKETMTEQQRESAMGKYTPDLQSAYLENPRKYDQLASKIENRFNAAGEPQKAAWIKQVFDEVTGRTLSADIDYLDKKIGVIDALEKLEHKGLRKALSQHVEKTAGASITKIDRLVDHVNALIKALNKDPSYKNFLSYITQAKTPAGVTALFNMSSEKYPQDLQPRARSDAFVSKTKTNASPAVPIPSRQNSDAPNNKSPAAKQVGVPEVLRRGMWRK